jgi:hypothetical protein
MQPYLLFSAWLRAHAVGQMKEKCDKQTRTAVGLATMSMARDLKTSKRLGAILQSKLSKSEVTFPYPHFLCHYVLTSVSTYHPKVSNGTLAARLGTRLERISELEAVLKKVTLTLTLNLAYPYPDPYYPYPNHC